MLDVGPAYTSDKFRGYHLPLFAIKLLSGSSKPDSRCYRRTKKIKDIDSKNPTWLIR